MKRACVMGFPVEHSLSPVLHGYWLRKYNIEGAYTKKAVKPGTLAQALEEIAAEGYSGCNLTMPLKEEALELMDALDESAREAGAVNTVVIGEGGTTGYNTDGFGFAQSLKAQAPRCDLAHVVILGAGGAARGVIPALARAGAGRFILVNRTAGRAEELAQALDTECGVLPWEERAEALGDATLLVNCSSLGMTGHPPLDLDLSALPQTATVADIVYRPLETPLLAAARKRGNPVAEGLPMLLHQGRPGFRRWFGRDPEVTPELHEIMKKAAA